MHIVTDEMLQPAAGSRIALLLLRAAVRAVGALPLAMRRCIGRSLGRIFALVPTRERKIADLQLDCFMRDSTRPASISAMYAHLGQTLFETLNLRPLLRDPQRYVDCPDFDKFALNKELEVPAIILTGHTGNWDLLAAYAVKRGIPLCVIGRPARQPAVHELLLGIRNGYGVKTLWRSGNAQAKEILSELKHKKVVAALIDQDTSVSSEFVPFFGLPAKTPNALIALGRKYRARFLSAFIFRAPDGRYSVFADWLDESLSSEEMLAEYHRRLEELLRRFPEQWVWFHKRWRSQPDGSKLSTDAYIRFLDERLTNG